jgi:hypothetical protein
MSRLENQTNLYGANNAMQNRAANFNDNIHKANLENQKLRDKDDKFFREQEKKNAH